MATPSLAMIPSGYKDGKLYSVLPNNAGGDFDVTRGSLATRVNKDGFIEPVGTLGADVVLNGDFEQVGADQVLNGDFSQGSQDWAITKGWGVSNNQYTHDGSTTDASVLQIIGLNGPAGTIYRLTLKVISAINVDLRFYSPNDGYISQIVNTGDH